MTPFVLHIEGWGEFLIPGLSAPHAGSHVPSPATATSPERPGDGTTDSRARMGGRRT